MARSIASRRAQRGVALLGLLAVAVMVFAYVLTSRLNAASQFVGVNREHNAQALAQAKQALIGWIALNAASNDANPGRLPCPEAGAYFGDPAQEGIAAGNCTLPAVGRLPWRTLGLEKLVDAAGEPLWYVVSPGWALPTVTSTLTINSDTVGQLTLDGNEAVALIIAPGPAIIAQAGTGCTAWTQVRPAAGAPDLRNYLECENANSPADTSFVGDRPGASFNDQVLRLSSADLMPALEAAVADRMQRQIAPAIKAAAYTSTTYSGLPAGAPLYPYPVPFTDPSTSSYQITGTQTYSPYDTIPAYANTSNPQGLLPFNSIASGCTAPLPCSSLPVSGSVRETLGFGYIDTVSCPPATSTEFVCTGLYYENSVEPWREVRIEMAATFSNFAMGFRALDASPVSQTVVEAKDNGTSTWQTLSRTIVQIRINDGLTYLPDGSLPPRGSATIRFRATMPNIDTMGWGSFADFRFRINRAVFTDHALLNKSDATLGWFVRNEWYRNTYYAVALPNTAQSLPSLGCSALGGNCIRFNDGGAYNIRALLVLAGRTDPTQTAAWPSSDRRRYVDHQNADNGTLYEQRRMRKSKIVLSPDINPADPYYAPFNDRVILVDWDSASPPNASQVVSLSPLRVVTLP